MRKTTRIRVLMAKMQVLPNQGRRSKEAEREQKLSVHSLCRGGEMQPSLKKLHLWTLLKGCNTIKWNFPLRGEKSLGRWLMPNVFTVPDTRFWQVPLHKWSTHLCSFNKGGDTSSPWGLEVQWLSWFEWMHYGFDGVKCAKVYINQVLIRREKAGVEALHRTEKKQSAGLKLKN